MNLKLFEIRDRSTFIPVMAVQMSGSPNEQEEYLMRRAGYNLDAPHCVILCRLECSGCDRNPTYDPYAWTGGARTMTVAHNFICKHFDELTTGDVIDVEFILGEKPERKTSERFS